MDGWRGWRSAPLGWNPNLSSARSVRESEPDQTACYRKQKRMARRKWPIDLAARAIVLKSAEAEYFS